MIGSHSTAHPVVRPTAKPTVHPTAKTDNTRKMSNYCWPAEYDSQLHYYRPQTKFAKVMFLQVSVILSTVGACVAAPGGHAWLVRGEHV